MKLAQKLMKLTRRYEDREVGDFLASDFFARIKSQCEKDAARGKWFSSFEYKDAKHFSFTAIQKGLGREGLNVCATNPSPSSFDVWWLKTQ